MARRAAVVAGVGVAAIVALGSAWVVGMRNKDSAVVAVQRRINKRFFNPRILPVAGRPGAQASLIRHVGRNSGREYATPVEAIETDNGFVVALVYGSKSDWVRNVLAGGPTTVLHEGGQYEVAHAELVPVADLAGSLPGQRSLKLFGVEEALRLRTVPV